MKPINSKLHGILDYTIALALASPFIVNYYSRNEDTWILGAIGGILATYSLFTNYEFGLIRLISMKVHLVFDVILGLLLIIVPWIYPLPHYYLYWPVFMGITMVLIVVFTSQVPFIITKRDLDITKP